MYKGTFPHKMVVVTGPSVVGKDTVADELIKWLPLKKIVTTTTRPMRYDEKRGLDYHFVSRERFEEMIEKDLLVEYTEYGEHYYGRQRKDMRKPSLEGLVPLLIVDPDEALEIQQNNPEALTIFIKPESINVIKKRLIARGSSIDEIDKRLRLTKEAMEKEPIFAYSVVNKDGKLEETVKLIRKTIRNYLGL